MKMDRIQINPQRDTRAGPTGIQLGNETGQADFIQPLGIGPLRQRGITPGQVLTAANLLGLLAMAAVWQGVGSSHLMWFVLGAVYAVGNLAYAELTTRFDPALAGRVNSALNLCTFSGAFAIQWGYGLLLDWLVAMGWTLAGCHRASFVSLAALLAVSLG